MDDFVLSPVLGNTSQFHMSAVTVPVYYLSPREVILLDSGYMNLGAGLLEMLRANRLTVRAVIGSHNHLDHCGNHALLKKEFGAEILMPEGEESPSPLAEREPLVPGDVSRWMEPPKDAFTADRLLLAEEGTVSVGGAEFTCIPLPGHTDSHTAIVTPDGVCYLGDALLSRTIAMRAKIPSTYDWAADLRSKEKILSFRYPAYVLAHDEVLTAIQAHAAWEIEDRYRRLDAFRDFLKRGLPASFEELETLMKEELSFSDGPHARTTLFRFNLRCSLHYFAESGAVRIRRKNGMECYENISL